MRKGREITVADGLWDTNVPEEVQAGSEDWVLPENVSWCVRTCIYKYVWCACGVRVVWCVCVCVCVCVC